jgi:tetratricopeptide (TPR) repeat protein
MTTAPGWPWRITATGPDNNFARLVRLDLAAMGGEITGRRMAEKSKTNSKKLTSTEQRELDVKIQFMEGLIRRDPDYVDALQLLGDHYTERGRFAEGLHVDERLASLEPGNSLVFYNLACSYSLTDQFDRAVFALDRALELGYRDFNWLSKDPDLRKLRAHPAYAELKEKIKQLKSQERQK